ncbi:RagB/SusD family nutrient uptake outer membrane protein [Pedobacter paludis]|uniref:RagB/SusD family nutrient uptake outer membrane protein n=1 Tax=Pedobacter paludis TaxID=2203212 RepID=A0A317F1P5_9SPHI|nr:RagB/SusD family nutrient uptake outer membrane protein [Pedobacter paludis]PWS33084.1 RagB/SusD family nutrient uptake outer membrane protein [Pedobacter paludis]
MKINHIYKKISLSIIMLVCFSFSGCKKFVDIPEPIDTIPSDLVFTSDSKADAAVRNLYLNMVGGVNAGFGGGLQIALGVSSDELTVTVATNQFNDFFIHTVNAGTTANANQYNPLYSIIYSCNAIIEGITKAPAGMTAAGKARFMGEAKFIRAAMYFYLINMYGDVPMPTTTDYVANSNIAKTPLAQVYELIINDLKFAQTNLPAPYLNPTQRFRANRYSASALLSRVYLYRQDWVNAELMATEVIDALNGASKFYDLETDLSKTFLIGSKEAILQMPPISTINYTYEAFSFISTGVPNYQISDALYATFEPGDLRKTNWIKTNTITTGGVPKAYNFPFKYKINSGAGGAKTEGTVFLRISEVYLNRAEARAQQNKLALAISDLDVIRGRSGITKIAITNPSISQADLLSTLAHERFVELFQEFGHRWLDLKRTGKADEVLKNTPNWRPEAKLFPFPANEIKYNPSLIQNPGYSN